MTNKHCGNCMKVKDGNDSSRYEKSWYCSYHKRRISRIETCGKEHLFMRPDCPKCGDLLHKEKDKWLCDSCDKEIA